MWARIDETGAVVDVYARPRAFKLDDVVHSPGVFRDNERLKELGIYPVRRVQLNAPDDTVGWTSSAVLVFNALDDIVEERVSWTELPDGADQRARRDARLAFDAKIARLHEIRAVTEMFMAENGKDFEADLTVLERRAIVEQVDGIVR